MTIQTAIEKAARGGYYFFGRPFEEMIDGYGVGGGTVYGIHESDGRVECSLYEVLLDPLFFQALGRTEGWDDETEIWMSDDTNDHPFMGGTIDYPYSEGAGMTYRVKTWKYKMHCMIDHISEEGGTITTYFETL